jgi:nucleoid DNA-binding protein
MALTQAQLLAAVADRAEFTKPPDTERVLDALEEIVLVELSNAQKIRIGGLVQLTVRVLRR